MYATTPKDAIIAFLTRPVDGFSAKPETIRFIKERSLPHRQLHFATFEDEQGMQMHFTCHAEEVSDGKWRLNGGYGGSVGGPQVSSPKVYLGGSGDSTGEFEAGGYVELSGHSVARVQLVSANNVILEDAVENDIVLFLADQFIEFPIEARLYDAQGKLLNTHPVLPG